MTTEIVAQPLAMTSREIAELAGKEHFHVLRDIDALLRTLNPELGLGFTSSTYVDSTGKRNRQFILDRDSSYCLVAGYDPNSRMLIIKRWQLLEESLRQPISDAELRTRVLEVLRQEKREEAALGYRRMMEPIDALPLSEQEKLPIKWQEAGRLNRLVLGMSAQEFRYWYEVPKNVPIRERMAVSQLAAIVALEEANTTLMIAGTPDLEREMALEKILEQRFYPVMSFRNRQLQLLDSRERKENWPLRPEDPRTAPSLAPINERIMRLELV